MWGGGGGGASGGGGKKKERVNKWTNLFSLNELSETLISIFVFFLNFFNH